MCISHHCQLAKAYSAGPAFPSIPPAPCCRRRRLAPRATRGAQARRRVWYVTDRELGAYIRALQQLFLLHVVERGGRAPLVVVWVLQTVPQARPAVPLQLLGQRPMGPGGWPGPPSLLACMRISDERSATVHGPHPSRVQLQLIAHQYLPRLHLPIGTAQVISLLATTGSVCRQGYSSMPMSVHEPRSATPARVHSVLPMSQCGQK